MGSDGDEATDIELEKSLRRRISTVVFVIAMQAEAQPLVGLSDSPPCVNKSFLSLGFTSKQQKSVIIVDPLGLRQALDMSTQDESLIIANDATLNDMEGSAVAYVAELLKVPVMFLKAVTDLIDGDKPTAQEFLQNLSLVTSALEETATKVTNFINGKNPFRPLTIIST